MAKSHTGRIVFLLNPMPKSLKLPFLLYRNEGFNDKIPT